MAKDTGAKREEKRIISLEDEKRLRDRTFELYKELDVLRSKPVRSPDEERHYEILKAQYSALYEEYAEKYSIVMEADKQEKPDDDNPKSSKLFRTMAIGLGALILLVTAVVVMGTMSRVDERKLEADYIKLDDDLSILGDGFEFTDDENDGDKILLSTDKRVPDFTKAQNSNQIPERKHFSWTSLDGATILSWSPQLYKETYDAYRAADRYVESPDFYRYISDVNNENVILEIANTLQSIGEGMGYSDWELANEAINFVQNIRYSTDIESTGHEEWPKYVTETVYDECGDCEDKAFFLAGILKYLGYDTVLIVFDGHIGVGILGNDTLEGTHYEYGGKKYYYIEPSYPGWEIGQLPSDINTTQVSFVPI